MPNANPADPGPSVNVRVLTEVWMRHGLAHLLVRFEGGLAGYRAQCACGAIGARYTDADLAQRSWLRHLISTAMRAGHPAIRPSTLGLPP